MARARWLSEEERAKILQLHADGMTAAEIATRVQRGVKSIKRVLVTATEADIGKQMAMTSRIPVQAPVAVPAPAPIARPVTQAPMTNASRQHLHALHQAAAIAHHRQEPVRATQRLPQPSVTRCVDQYASQEQQATSFVNVIPDDDDDDESMVTQQLQSLVTPTVTLVRRPPRIQEAVPVPTDTSRRVAATQRSSKPKKMAQAESQLTPMLTSFEEELRLSQESSTQSAPTTSSDASSAKRRRVNNEAVSNHLDVSNTGTFSLHEALKSLEASIERMKTSQSGILEERIFQLFIRFRADVRLIELEGQQTARRGTQFQHLEGPGATTSFI